MAMIETLAINRIARPATILRMDMNMLVRQVLADLEGDEGDRRRGDEQKLNGDREVPVDEAQQVLLVARGLGGAGGFGGLDIGEGGDLDRLRPGGKFGNIHVGSGGTKW